MIEIDRCEGLTAREEQGDDMTVFTAAATEAGRYLHWGVINISVTNLLVILAMIVLFVLALVIPFGRHRPTDDRDDRSRP